MGLGTLPSVGRVRAGLVMLLATWSCTSGAETGPTFGQARLVLAPSVSGPARVGVADVQSLRVVVTRMGGEVVYDSVMPVVSSSVALDLSLDYTPPSELFTLEVEVLDGAEQIVFRDGPIDFTVSDESTDIPLMVQLRYVGTGHDAVSVEITPSVAEAAGGDVVEFVARAIGEDGAPIPGTPIVWSIDDASIGTLENDGAIARLTAVRPGVVEITAQLLTPMEDPLASTATVRVEDRNEAPTAVAGPDQTLIDHDGSGTEDVTLNGSESFDPDGSIVSYVWSLRGDPFATGVSFTGALGIGRHEVTLRVTDDRGATDTDTVVVAVDEAPSARLVVNIESDVANARVRTGEDSDIDCYSNGRGGELGTCSAEYEPGVSVVLGASVDQGAAAGFVRWTDGNGNALPGCDDIDPCTIEVFGEQTVSAHFVAGEVRRFLTVDPPVLEPKAQSSTNVTISTRVLDANGRALAGAKVVFVSFGGCFDWAEPRADDSDEAIATSGSGGYVEATGRACVRDPDGENDPLFGVRLAGSSTPLREYRLAVAEPLPRDAFILPVSEPVQVIACGRTPTPFEVVVSRLDVAGLADVPVVWEYDNQFAYRTTKDGRSVSGYAEPVDCHVTTHRVTATIFSESGSHSVTFEVVVRNDE